MDFGDYDEEYISTLMTPRGWNAFQIPPAATSRGHKAEDWRGKQIWKGEITVLNKSKGEKNRWLVQLLNDDKTVFAETLIEDTYDRKIDRWYDSTRFFAILIENAKGQKANIGIGFVDRNDSFDFISSLDDYTKSLRMEKGIDKYDVQEIEKDFSLKDGEKIEIKIKGLTDKKKPKEKSGGLKKLGPPRGSSKLQPPPPAAKQKTEQEPEHEDEENKNLDDLFSNDTFEPKQKDDVFGLLDF